MTTSTIAATCPPRSARGRAASSWASPSTFSLRHWGCQRRNEQTRPDPARSKSGSGEHRTSPVVRRVLRGAAGGLLDLI